MAKQIINVGARNNDGTGDSLRVGATKVNDNFSEIYNLLGDGESLSVVSRINAGQGLTVSNSTGVVLITGTIASNNDLGMIKIGENLTISQDGTLSAQQTTYTLPTASSTVLGGVKVGTGLSISQGVLSANNPTPYTLPIATSSIRGGVKVGANLSVTADGTISGHPDYLLPTATDSILGGIKIGAGLSISQGTVSVTSTSNSSDRLVNGLNEVVLDANGVLINAGSYTKITMNSFNGGVASKVVWTSTEDFISGAKLLIQLECDETGGVNTWETQMCEAVIAVRGHSDTSIPVMSVYGVTHTSASPLMTFTVDRNPVTKLIEVTGTRTGTARLSGGASLRIHSVETGTMD
jgi:hypothetical protein